MIQGKKILAIIPARGGSKGIPRKNIVEVGGKPLIAWTIEAAKNSTYIDKLILSSDDDEIMKVAEEWGCEVPFKRPLELSQDDTPGIEPVLHAVREVEGFDYLVLLQPTSPLRSTEDIDQCIQMCIEGQAESCVSIVETDKSPYWMYTLDQEDTLKKLINDENQYYQRQKAPKVFALNGAIYVADINRVLQSRSLVDHRTLGYVMPKERSIDIDTKMDLLLAEALIKQPL